MSRFVWELQQPDPAAVRGLILQLGLSPLLASLLVSRGIREPEAASRFLNPSLDQLHDPFLMAGMDRVVCRIEEAVSRREKILLYGDYDVDGITSVVILKKCLEACGADVGYHVPERLTEGYGLQPARIRRAADDGVRLVISVDSGIRASEAAQEARNCGLDLIITDHHLPEKELPPAYAVLNPNLPDCRYPDKNLAGVGVAFKLVQALLCRTGRQHWIPSILKLVAIGTVADIVPLTGENRILVKFGLDGLRQPRNPGLKALLESAGMLGRQVDYADVGFRLAPRINAVGRMGETADAVRLFDAMGEEEARRLAARLSDKNLLRRQEQEEILKTIEEKARSEPGAFQEPVIVLWDQGWHRGVVGIVASRVMESYGHAALIASVEGDQAVGSGRSFGSLHLLEALETCSDLLEKFGGHRHAAGFTIRADRLPLLRSRLNEHARRCGHIPQPSITVDALLPLSEVSAATWEDISRLAPFGFGNPLPIFQDDQLPVRAGPFLLKERHLKWKLNAPFCSEAIGWNQAGKLEEVRQARFLKAVYQLAMNEYQGERFLMASLRDFAP